MSRRPKQQVSIPDRERLILFVSECERLDQHKYLQSAFNVSFTVSAEQGQPWKYTVPEPDPEVLESYLIRLRRFMSDGEPIFVNAVRNLARKLLTDAALRDDLDRVAAEWKQSLMNDGIRITLNDEPITPELAWDLYINGEYFHVNLDKRQRLAQYVDPASSAMLRWRFLSQVDNATVYVFDVGRVIRKGLRDGAFAFIEGDGDNQVDPADNRS